MNQLKHEWCELDLACKSALIIGALLLPELIFAIFFEPITHHPSIAAIFPQAFQAFSAISLE